MSNPTPTIAELWREMQNDIHDLDVAYSCIRVGKDRVSRGFFVEVSKKVLDRHVIRKDEILSKMQPLRSTLLERCVEIEDSTPICTGIAEFEVVREDDVVFIERDMISITLNGPFCAEPDRLLEFSAICAFWAWELQQRAKEKE